MAKRKNDQTGNGADAGNRASDQATLRIDDEIRKPDSEGSIEPFELTSGTESRTRKPRSDAGVRKGPRRRGAAEAESAQNLAGILLSLHMMAAALLQTPELEITQEESVRLGAAIAHVNDLYGGLILPEKAAAWIQLIMVAGTIYGPRVIVISARKSKKKEADPKVKETIMQFAQA